MSVRTHSSSNKVPSVTRKPGSIRLILLGYDVAHSGAMGYSGQRQGHGINPRAENQQFLLPPKRAKMPLLSISYDDIAFSSRHHEITRVNLVFLPPPKLERTAVLGALGRPFGPGPCQLLSAPLSLSPHRQTAGSAFASVGRSFGRDGMFFAVLLACIKANLSARASLGPRQTSSCFPVLAARLSAVDPYQGMARLPSLTPSSAVECFPGFPSSLSDHPNS